MMTSQRFKIIIIIIIFLIVILILIFVLTLYFSCHFWPVGLGTVDISWQLLWMSSDRFIITFLSLLFSFSFNYFLLLGFGFTGEWERRRGEEVRGEFEDDGDYK